MISPLKDCPVVVGMGPSGLFLARQLKRLGGPVGAIARPGDVGISSNAVTRGLLKVATSSEDVVNALESIKDAVSDRNIKLCMASDQYLTLVLGIPDEMLLSYGLTQEEIDSFRLINNKSELDKVLASQSLIPETYAFDDVPPTAYPCIVKWNEKRVMTRSNTLSKIKVVYDRNELQKLIARLEAEGFSGEDVIVQRYIVGNNSLQYSYGGYYQNGRTIAGICVNQVRQYPQGISSCVVEVTGQIADSVKSTAEILASDLSFTGFLEVECKVDPVSSKPYVLDVNPRPWGWISILGKKYPKFYEALMGKQPIPIAEKVMWKTLPRNLFAFRNRQNVQPPAERRVKCIDLFDRDDIRPVLALGLTAFKKVIRP